MSKAADRLQSVSSRIDELNREYQSLPPGHPRRRQIHREIAPLGAERRRLDRRQRGRSR